ncbi:MAG: Uma2 family endonuclease [Cyanobacteria bacterium P01_G01_bin.54]
MVVALPQPSSLESFLQRPEIDESPAWEFFAGVVSQKPMPGVQHSRLQVRLAGLINLHSETLEALTELRCTIGGRSVVPDIAVLAATEIPVDTAGVVSRQGIDFAPRWAIEILSPDQRSLKVTRKILHLLRYGTQIGWLIDPEERVVLVFEPNCLPREFTAKMVLPMLQDLELELTVEQLFGWLKIGPSVSAD